MERYHDTRNDPLPMHSHRHDSERAKLAKQTARYLARGGKIQQIGHQMSDKAAAFTINPERTPIYAHLFAPVASEAAAESAQPTPKKLVALIRANAAWGNSPKWIARKYHMTEKCVRQIARDNQITFHAQR